MPWTVPVSIKLNHYPTLVSYNYAVHRFACEVTKHQNDKVAFAAYTLLYRNMSAKTAAKFPKNLILTVFEVMLQGLDRFANNSYVTSFSLFGNTNIWLVQDVHNCGTYKVAEK